MHTILFFLVTIPIGSVGWIDLGNLVSTIVVVVYIYRFGRSRVTKPDMDAALEKKASKNMVISELEKQNLKIKSVTDLSKMQDKYLKEVLEEQHAILETVQDDIKQLLKRKQ